MRIRLGLLFAAVVLAACSSSATSTSTSDAGSNADAAGSDGSTTVPTCNPLAPEWDCMLPFPSDAWRVGGRIRLSETALPHMQGGGPVIDLFAPHPTDGASVLPQIALRIPGGISDAGVVPFPLQDAPTMTLDDGMAPASIVQLLDAETGKPVVHFAEIDPRPTNPDDRSLMIRPLIRLQNAHRYIVAIRAAGPSGGLRRPDGSAIAPPAHFLQLRDDAKAGLPDSAHYNTQIFPVLEKAGIARKDLLIAWDFTTESEATANSDMLAVREAGLAAMKTLPVAVTVTSVTENETEDIARHIEGMLTVPLFLDQPDPGGLLWRNGTQIQQHGTVQVPFTALVPPSVLKSGGPARVLQFGHGFFGSRHEVDGKDAFPASFANQAGMIVVAVDWWGMSTPDVVKLVEQLLSNATDALSFVDRTHQGMVNQLALGEAVNGALGAVPALQDAKGKPLFDPSQLYFYGISQGSILGMTFVSLSPRIDRAVFSVGGSGFGLMMSRANPFASFLDLIDGATGDAFLTLKVTLVMQTVLDRIDPVTYLPHLRSATFVGSPTQRHILQQTGVSDTQVPSIAAHVQARTLGLPLLTPAPRKIWGISEASAPLESAMVEFDFHQQVPDLLPIPVANGNPVHEGVRHSKAGRVQVEKFLHPGAMVEQTCDGVCDPE